MNKRKTIRSLMLTLVFAMTLAACSFISVSAIAGDGTVNVDFGSKHADFAEAVCEGIGAQYGATVNGSILSFNVKQGDKYEVAWLIIYNALPENRFDKEEYLYDPYNLKPVDEYEDQDTWNADHGALDKTYVDNSNTVYAQWFRRTEVSFKIEPPVCGTEVTVSDGVQNPTPRISDLKGNVRTVSKDGPVWYDPDTQEMYEGTMKGGMTYNALFGVAADFKYYTDKDAFTVENGEVDLEHSWITLQGAVLTINVKAVHDWDEGKVTKEPTTTEEGVKTYTCKACGATRTEAVPKTEPSPVPAAAGPLLAKMTAKGKTSMMFTWNKVSGAQGYDIYLSRCNYKGKELTPKKVKTIKGNKTLKWTKKGLKANIAYKGYVRAWKKVDGKKQYFRTSLTMHAFAAGEDREFTNSKAVSVKKKSVSLKKGKTYKIKASVKKLKAGKKLIAKGHTKKLRYVSSDKKVATVSSSGKITAKGQGSCKVYAIAANGASAAVKVTVN